MTINYTTLLGLAQPVTGTEAGTWGDTVNDEITALLEDAVANAASINVTAGDATLTQTNGQTDQARMAILLVTGTPGTTRNIVAPSQSKWYIVKNGSNGAVVLKGSATTGVTIPVGVEALVFWNGSDFEIVGVNGPASSTDNAIARFDSTTGKVIQNSGVTIDDSNNISGVAQLNATTVDTTNIEVTAIKAKDGTASASIADSTGVMTLASSVLTTTDINGGTIDGTTIGGASAAAGTFTNLTATGTVTVPNDSISGDKVEGGTINATTITTLTSTTGNITTAVVGAGTVSAPSITTTGDTNTGIFFPAADTIAFTEGGAEAMRIDSSGNVGIGVTPSAWNLGKVLEIGFTGNSVWASASNNISIVQNAFYTSGYKYVRTDGASLYDQNSGSHRWFTAPSGTAGNAITFTQAMTLAASGGLQTLNTVGVGNATPSTSGAGITFPATQSASSDANTLDDYEQGTWTPSFQATSGSATYTTQTGNYVKVGRMVTVTFYIAVNVSSSLVCNGNIAGLPFTTSNSNYAGASFSVWSGSFGGYCTVLGLSGGAATTIQLRATGTANAAPVLITPSITNGTEIAGTLTYFAAD